MTVFDPEDLIASALGALNKAGTDTGMLNSRFNSPAVRQVVDHWPLDPHNLPAITKITATKLVVDATLGAVVASGAGSILIPGLSALSQQLSDIEFSIVGPPPIKPPRPPR